MAKIIKIESCFECPYIRMFQGNDNVYCAVCDDTPEELIELGTKEEVLTSKYIHPECEVDDLIEDKINNTKLYDADDACKHEIVSEWNGIRCKKCGG